MKKAVRLSWLDVSRHRPVLYGFAALWIVFLHMEYTVPSAGALLPLRVFQSLGACGVEIFVLLTGAGLYRSMERDPDILVFYKKRFTRVFVPAVIVGLVHFGVSAGSLLHWLACSLYFPYWLGIDTLWYVSFILTMYLLYPFLHRIQKRQPRGLWALMLITAAGALAASTVRTEWTETCIRGVSRIPVFLLGCILAPRLERGMEFPLWLTPAALAGFVGFYLLAQRFPGALYFWRTLGYVCLAVFLILLITWLCERCRLGAPGRFIYRCFAFCGGISLEIYLLFDRICGWLRRLPEYAAGGISLLKLEALALVLTILLGWLLSRMCRNLIKDFNPLDTPER